LDSSISSFSLTPELKNLAPPQSQEDESSGQSASQQLMNSFSDTLTQKLHQVESLQQNAQTKMKQFASGQIDDVHDVSVSLQKASMGLNVATAVRQKVLEGIDELQQMR
jgi:flagellar hook-basal body complex protein FliE